MNLTEQITAAVQYAEATWGLDVEPVSAGSAGGVPWVCVDTGEATPYVILDSPPRSVPTPLSLADGLTVEWMAADVMDTLTASAPTQARAPKGSLIGGQWINTPGGMLAGLTVPGGDEAMTIAVGDHTFTGSPAEPHGRESEIQSNGYSTPTLIHSTKGDPESALAFQSAIQRAKDANPYGASVYVYEASDYEDMDLWLTEDGTAGIALHNGDIVSGFNDGSNPANKGFVLHGMATAQAAGGTRADAFDTVLPDIYAKAGMEVVGRVKWDDDYAPDGWDYDQFAKFNGGRPDVVFMRLNEDGWWGKYTPGQGQAVESYEDGQALTASAASVEGHVDGLVVPLIPAGLFDSLRGRVGTQKPLHELLAIRLGPSHPDSLQVQPGRFALINADQVRAPKGTPQGGEWIDTPGGMARQIAGVNRAVGGLGKPITDPTSLDDMDDSYTDLVSAVNPGYLANPEDVRYNQNCQRVVQAVEMRARGFDAKAAAWDGTRDDSISIEDCWVDPATGSVRLFNAELPPRQARSVITSQYPPGSRFIMSGWSESEQYGHVWNGEIQADGTLLEVDGQGGSLMGDNILDFYDEVQWLRVDDLTPTDTMFDPPPLVITSDTDPMAQNPPYLGGSILGSVDPITAGQAAGYDVVEARDLGTVYHLIVADPPRKWSDSLLVMDKATGAVGYVSRFNHQPVQTSPQEAS